jgi:ABC-type microcin C transport system permease subunit YejB
MSITMSISSGLFTFFIALLIEVPIEIRGNLGGLD